ncbi:MAG: DUF4097 family beta strand repeat-containing protein [Candidatus Aminicenantia bacterium]
MKIKNLLKIFLVLIICSSCISLSPRSFYREFNCPENAQIKIENLNGSLEIMGWKKEKLEIKALKVGSSRRVRETDIEIKKTDKKLTIKTLPPSIHPEQVEVNYRLRLPEKIKLEEININQGNVYLYQVYGEIILKINRGDIEIEDFSGYLQAMTGEGNITVRIYEIKKNDRIILETNEGDILLFLPSLFNARIKAVTRQGNIQGDIISAEESTQLKEIDKKFGTGEGLIELYSTNGNIKIYFL